MRKTSYEGRARFIMAGFRQTLAVKSDQSTPLYHFGEAMPLAGMERAEVKAMIERPLDSLRVKLIDREQVVDRIFRETGGLPNLVQFYCQTLIKQVDATKNAVISPNRLAAWYMTIPIFATLSSKHSSQMLCRWNERLSLR